MLREDTACPFFRLAFTNFVSLSLDHHLPAYQLRHVDMGSKEGGVLPTDRPAHLSHNGLKTPSLNAQDQADMAGVGKKQRFIVSTA